LTCHSIRPINPPIEIFDYSSLSAGSKFRLVSFVLAIAVMVALIAYAAQSAWRRGNDLREKLTAVHLQSFQIADHFQRTIWELNNVVLRYGVYHDTNDWGHFERVSKQLDKWIDDERPILSTEKEKSILDLINAKYDDYMGAASNIEVRVRSQAQPTTPLAEFTDFEKEAEQILRLGFDLASAHHESMNTFLSGTNKSLGYLRFLLATSLALLLLAGGGLAVVVYGELIAPLRIKLVESQALLDRQEKLASLGMLAAGVAHEIRNPLTAIKAWLFIQQKQLKAGTAEQADAEIISNEVNRLERIVRDVLLFARPSDPELRVVSAVEPLRKVQALLGPNLQKSRVQLLLEDSVAANVQVDPGQIQQVLINLVQNAAESIERDGTITLRTRIATRPLAERQREVVILEVSDTGKGIPPEVEKRLFDPFFTTKENGTGLGLSIAARIVEKHGGVLQYQTQVSQGTTFGVVLPRV
jgi:signal transduction histidine kinase